MGPMLAPRVALRNKQPALIARRRDGHLVPIEQPPRIVDAVRFEIRFQLRQPNLNRLTLARRVVFDVALK